MENPVKILLDSGANAFCAGQTISGKVKCTFANDEIIRAIKVSYIGSAKTKWLANVGKAQRPFWAEEIYFDEEHILVQGNEENQFRLTAGTYTYPFSYRLPQEIPTSFSDRCGSVQYKIIVVVDRPWMSNYQDEHLLFVISPLDLNLLPVRDPFSKSVEETLRWCCYNAGEITFTVSLPVTGYAADQQINIGSYVQNMSNVNIAAVQYEIIRTNEYSADNPWKNKRYFKYTLANCTTGSIEAHVEKSWTSSMKIPVKNILNLLSCNIMNASHHLEAKVILPFPYPYLKITCPITLGTIPLTGIETSLPGPPTHSNSSAVSTSRNLDILEGSTLAGSPLQSYGESIPHSSEMKMNRI
ncbi:hypothetical protein ILUMI_06051 [Ignelater luminosus]|uniref:Arrestin C-terminal-like domain-containing protein n=1 Tax=Ignelater luminosus TaxID=2038154 RepID=A0A8K0GJH8_IGNLU|nr:hypothetical protein ILUMI_06051 [Ignelater luminosus]